MLKITRHYLTINDQNGPRRVHYRRCGNGPTLLMIHQSPRSSAEYETLMRDWGKYFTCIAPDTPGFGLSQPLKIKNPDIYDYAHALAVFIKTAGIDGTAAYGYHSGGTILLAMQKHHPNLLRSIALGAYSVWLDSESEIFGDAYLPAFKPELYGDHLTWLWNRIMEQHWFFPWYDCRDESRYGAPHRDPQKIHDVIMDMLNSGDSYRDGYGAVLRAPYDVPENATGNPPCIITATNHDPLQAHIDRLGALPDNWSAHKVESNEDQNAASLSFLRDNQSCTHDHIAADNSAGYIEIKCDGFDGHIHWQGALGSGILHLHAPAHSVEVAPNKNAINIDLPGHGFSSDWGGTPPTDWNAWQNIIDTICAKMNINSVNYASIPDGDAELLYPDLTPDPFGNYLNIAWQVTRASHFFSPWYEANAENAISVDQDQITTDRLAIEHKARMCATAAKAYHIALEERGKSL